MAWLALIVSCASLAIATFFYVRFSKKDEISTQNLSNRIGSLLSEFNSVSSSNIDLLDDRTQELRRTVELADLKIKKLNRLIDRAENLKSQLKVEPDKSLDGALDSGFQSKREKVLDLAEDGFEPSDIAVKTGLSLGEVSVILRLNRSRISGEKLQSEVPAQ